MRLAFAFTMKTHTAPTRARSQSGFTLIEVLVAILICSIGLLGIVGLQARAIQYTVGAEDASRAVRLADEAAWHMLDLNTTNLPADVYAAWQARVRDPNLGFAYGDGNIVIDPTDADRIARITITWTPPGAASGAAPNRYSTEVAVSR